MFYRKFVAFCIIAAAYWFSACYTALSYPDEIDYGHGIFHTHGTGTDHTGYNNNHFAMSQGRGQSHSHDKSDSNQPHGNGIYKSHRHRVSDIWHGDHSSATTYYDNHAQETRYNWHKHSKFGHIHDVDQHEFRHWHRLLDNYHHVENEDGDIVPAKKPCPDTCLAGCDEDVNCLPDPCADCLSECIDDGNGSRECPDKGTPVDPCKECPTTCVDGKCPDLEEGCVGEMCDDETPPVVIPPRRDNPVNRQPESNDDNTDDDMGVDTDDDDTEMTPTPLVMTYEHTFPKGASFQHIPLDTVIQFADHPFDHLTNIDWSIASRGISGWTPHKQRSTRHGGYIGKGIGFITIMDQEETIELTGTYDNWTGERSSTYKQLTLREGGLTLVGVPLRSKWLATVGDFYKRFDNVLSVKGIDPDLEIPEGRPSITNDWFVELDNDTEITCCTSYLIESEGADQYSVWGVPWAYVPPSAAPSIIREGKLSTTWGAIKRARKTRL